MSKTKLTVSEFKEATSKKGISFKWKNKNMFLDWGQLYAVKIFRDTLPTIRSFDITFDQDEIKTVYQTHLIKGSKISNIQFFIKTTTNKKIKFDRYSNIESYSKFANYSTFEVKDIKLDTYQNKALKMVLEKQISIITGYAGTGKSSTVKVISDILEKDGWTIFRVAPTGKASKVIGGATVHSWLLPLVEEINREIVITGFQRYKMVENSCLIVDESSMLDNDLWNEIKKIWNQSKSIANKKIIFVGDHGQLRPVGEGEPFLNAVEKKLFPITELKKIHRTRGNNDLINFVNTLREKGIIDHDKKYKNVELISKETALDLVVQNHHIQMISPLRNYGNGSLRLNKIIKEKMQKTDNPDFFTLSFSKEENKFLEHTPVHINDKIIVTKNFWEWDVMNGTTGIYLGKEKTKLYNHVRKESKLKNCFKFLNTVTKKHFYLPISGDVQINIELGYVITIHKAQGSEYDEVIVLLNGTQVSKRMIYTAVTRAKKRLKIVL